MPWNSWEVSADTLKRTATKGYDNLPGIRRCCCWAHLRRYFVEAVPKGKELDYNTPVA